MDMASGGRTKQKPYDLIFIQAPESEAKVIFYNRFRHNPERVTCTCCGEDYSIQTDAEFAQSSGYDRNCGYDKELRRYVESAPTEGWRRSEEPQTIDEFCQREDVLVIPSSDIKPSERVGEVPVQGYVYI